MNELTELVMNIVEKKDRTKIFNIILLILTLGMLVYFCVDNNNLMTLINSIPILNIFWLSLAILSIFIYWLFDAKILYTIASSIYHNKYKYKNALRVTMVGQYFNSVTPFALAGQPMQIVTMIRQGVSSGVAFSILIQKFLVYQTSLTIYSLAVILFKYGYFKENFPNFMPLALIGFLVQSFIVILLLLFSLNRKFTTKLISIVFKLLAKVHIIKDPDKTSKNVETQLDYYIDNNKAMNKNFKLTLKLYLTTFVQFTIFYIVPFLIYKAFHNPGFPVVDMISANAFVVMISSYTPLPGGTGTSEGSFLTLFNMFFNSEDTKQAMLLWRFITYYSCIVFGYIFARFITKHKEIDIDMDKIMRGNNK